MAKTHELVRIEFQEYLWRALHVFNIYRLLLTSGLILVNELSNTQQMLGSSHPKLYIWVIGSYFVFALIVIGLLLLRKPDYKASVVLQLSVDIVAIVAVIYASGGINNGLGVLLAVSVGIASLLIGNRRAMAVPAAATLALFAQVLFAHYVDGAPLEMTNVAFLGVSFFIIAFLTLTLAKRLHYSEMTAIESQADLASMQAVNKDIIQTLNSGVIVVDRNLDIQLMNDSAWKVLGMPTKAGNQPLKQINREIYLATKQWLAQPISEVMLLHLESRNMELQLSFRNLGEDEHNLILIFLEDTSKLTQQAQELKLSSLGRLTASIAHEIRNPLAAISHASQLLNESENIKPEDKDLCQMIGRHTQRMNNIIENVLNLSQRRPPQQEEILLLPLIEQVVTDLRRNDDGSKIELNIEPETIRTQFDRSQLIQVITNLCENGLRYSQQATGRATLLISAGQEYPSASTYLDIIDQGPGVEEQVRDKIFEPFFTTSKGGTGLGLYLARELCESNGARLTYIPVPNGVGSCFRIQFP